MELAEFVAFFHARDAAHTIAAQAEREAAQAEREAMHEAAAKAAADADSRVAAIKAESLAATNRSNILQALTLLIYRCRNTADGAAMDAAPESSPTAASPRWRDDPSLFDTLSAKVARASELSTEISAAISAAKCTEAPPGCPERPSKKNPSADSVHAHVQPVASAVGHVLSSGRWDGPGRPGDQPRFVEILRERSYNDLPNSHIPDFAAALGRGESTPAQLTAESQVGVLECKKCGTMHVLSTLARCPGEIQTAGYLAQSLYAAIACRADLTDLATLPMSVFGVYTDSKTSTLVEVRVIVCVTGVLVEVVYSRMPFLPGATLPGGTAGVDNNAAACGAVAFGLGVMAALSDPRLRASAAAAFIQDVIPCPEGVELPALAPFLGCGKFARVFCLNGTIAVKVPVSSLTSMQEWTAAIAAEENALTSLAARRPRCFHFPALVAPAALTRARGNAAALMTGPLTAGRQSTHSTTVFLRVVAGDSTAASASAESVRPVQGLLTTPVCTMLPEALGDLRQRIPLAERTIPLLQFLSLSIALPLLAAQAYARSIRLSHFDAHPMNVAMHGWNPGIGVELLRRAASVAQDQCGTESTSCAAASSAELRPVDLPPAMCLSVILNDWGSARRTGVAGFSMDRAIAIDTAQVVDLVRHILQHMLDFMPAHELVDTASDGVADWWRLILPQLQGISVNLRSSKGLAEGIAPHTCLLRALGLVDEAAIATASCAGSKRRRDAGAATSADGTEAIDSEVHADDAGNCKVELLCRTAAAATGCTCYSSGFTVRSFGALLPVAMAARGDDGGDEERLADVLGTSAELGTGPFPDGADAVAAAAEVACNVIMPEPVVAASSSALVPGSAASVEGSAALAASHDVILVSNIAGFFNETTLQRVMSAFGAVKRCMLLPSDAATQAGPVAVRRALVQYEDPQVAARVVAGLTDFTIGGLLLGVAAAPATFVVCHPE